MIEWDFRPLGVEGAIDAAFGVIRAETSDPSQEQDAPETVPDATDLPDDTRDGNAEDATPAPDDDDGDPA